MFGQLRDEEGLSLFEELKPGARLRGLSPAGVAEIVQVSHFGADALNLMFRADGRIGERLVYRGDEAGFESGSISGRLDDCVGREAAQAALSDKVRSAPSRLTAAGPLRPPSRPSRRDK